jgi:hypothetical protein
MPAWTDERKMVPNAWLDATKLKEEPFWSTRRVSLLRLATIRANRARIGICYFNGERIQRDHPMHKE